MPKGIHANWDSILRCLSSIERLHASQRLFKSVIYQASYKFTEFQAHMYMDSILDAGNYLTADINLL